jgi:Porphobilinogen deaminase
LLAPLQHQDTYYRVTAERAVNKRLNGGCQAPIACFATLSDGEIWLRGLVGSTDGQQMITGDIKGAPQNAEQLGITLAEDLLNRGAQRILDDVYGK